VVQVWAAPLLLLLLHLDYLMSWAVLLTGCLLLLLWLPPLPSWLVLDRRG
jgi:hypothetical protein